MKLNQLCRVRSHWLLLSNLVGSVFSQTLELINIRTRILKGANSSFFLCTGILILDISSLPSGQNTWHIGKKIFLYQCPILPKISPDQVNLYSILVSWLQKYWTHKSFDCAANFSFIFKQGNVNTYSKWLMDAKLWSPGQLIKLQHNSYT